MKNLKLEDRISLNYVLLFLVLILFSNIILVYSLQRQSKKALVSLAQNKVEDKNSSAFFIKNEDRERFNDFAKITNLPENFLERINRVIDKKQKNN